MSRALEINRKMFVFFFDISKAFDTMWTSGLLKLFNMGITEKTWHILY